VRPRQATSSAANPVALQPAKKVEAAGKAIHSPEPMRGEAAAGAVPERIAGSQHRTRRPRQSSTGSTENGTGTASARVDLASRSGAAAEYISALPAHLDLIATNRKAILAMPMIASQGAGEESDMMRVLLLGGTTEASQIAGACRGWHFRSLLLAGRTATPVTQPLPTRVGGFGGVEGLPNISARKNYHVIDATHPFASQISRNAWRPARRLPRR